MSTLTADRGTRVFFVVGLCVLLLAALAASPALRGSSGSATTKSTWVYSVPEDDFVLEDLSF